MKKFTPINRKFPHFLHGGDYNPEQWMDMPEIWDEDMRLMKQANCNAMTVGVFSWVSLEPEEGKFNFDWLDDIMERINKNRAYAVLATPSGAKPAWISKKYPEVLRVDSNRVRKLHGDRHNHCFTSPVYRNKVNTINTKLAERYQNHPALLVWHISNEYGGECHCELCQKAFRGWLMNKYSYDLDKLNHAWWSAFRSHTYTDWEQIESPAPHGEMYMHGLNLDWKRFVTDQTIDFMNNEIRPIKEITPDVPVTTNFWGTYTGINYFKFAPYLDVISWDTYPLWHGEADDFKLAGDVAFKHDINRCIKGGKPFMLMESTPSMASSQVVAKLKRPGMHILSSLQAVAHGSDTVQYFQWRKSRGSWEKFHGAVVDHCGHENTRVFKEVSELGSMLKKLDAVIGTSVNAEVAVIYDWENCWAIDDMSALRKEGRDYEETCLEHYRAFLEQGIPVDVIDMECCISKYKLVVAPMLYMIRGGIAEKIDAFVKNGGIFVTTYWSGIVDENDLCYLGGFPGPLRKALGIWSEEIDSLYDGQTNKVAIKDGNQLGLSGQYEAHELCDLIHAEAAQVMAEYLQDFYCGRPALTVNAYGKGKAYYIAFRSSYGFLKDFYTCVADQAGIKRILKANLPEGVLVQTRTNGVSDFVFIMNFSGKQKTVELDKKSYTDMFTSREIEGEVSLKPYGAAVLKCNVQLKI